MSALVDGVEAVEAIISDQQTAAYPDAPIPGQGLTVCGWIFLMLGIATVFGAWMFDTTVMSESLGSPLAGTYEPAHSVVNIGLQQKQMMIFLSGLALCLVGIMGIYLGTATSAIRAAFLTGAKA
jgi:hypothetical protein